MKRIALLIATICALAVAVPAWATSTHQAKVDPKGKQSCKIHRRGYRARGTLVSATLTPATGKHRYNGTITVDITRANHKAQTGTKTFTLTDARVKFGKGVSATTTKWGDRVKLSGRITGTKAGCNGAQTVTLHEIVIKAPKSSKTS